MKDCTIWIGSFAIYLERTTPERVPRNITTSSDGHLIALLLRDKQIVFDTD
jgi:hypothetical protein